MMNKIISRTYRFLFISLILLAACAVTANASEQSSSNYTIKTDAVSGGGGQSISDTYAVEHTTGQDSVIGDSSSDHYDSYGGFWNTVGELDTDGDGIPDGNGTNLCIGGNTADCDDNCPNTPNADQADGDNDGTGDVCDNCSATFNPGQQDTDSDGYGNICDCDLDNDNAVGFQDFIIFKAAWLSTTSSGNWNPDADFDSDNAVGFQDFIIFKGRWLSTAPWE